MADPSTQPFPLVQWIDRRSRRQRVVVLGALAVYFSIPVWRWLASSLLDRWWYDQLTDAPVWSRRVVAQVILTVVAALVSLLVMLLSNRFALVTEPQPDQKTFRPIAVVAGRLGPATRWLAYGLPIYFAWNIGAAAGRYWKQWLTFWYSRSVGESAPEVGFDVGYHLFRLPLVSATTSWLMSLLLVTIAMTAVVLTLNGCLRIPMHGRRSSPRAVRQLAALAAAWFAVKAIDNWFVKYPRLASQRSGRFDGAGFAEMHGPGIAYRPLALLALAIAVALALFAAGRIRPRWALSMIVVFAVAHVALVMLLPGILQRVVVKPAEAERELTYIQHNLDATRYAFGLEAGSSSTRVVLDGISDATATDVARIPLFNTNQLTGSLQVLQGTRGTRIIDVDLDRYAVGGSTGAPRPVYLATRDASLGELPERGWIQAHLVYTHGDGLVATYADETSAAGLPEFSQLEVDLGLTKPELYFGPNLAGWYVFVGTDREETGGATYTGSTGVAMDSFGRRLIGAVALGDYNVAVSSEFGPETRLLYRRGVGQRVKALAPFLTLDSDPYPVIADGRIVWVVYGYTTSSTYPYAQHTSVAGARGVNYLRRAVVATVDGYDGTVHLYRTDAGLSDPVLDVWDRILPGLLEPIDALPGDIAPHVRYGSDLFAVQSSLLGIYHVDDAETLFSGTDSWSVAPAPSANTDQSGSGPAPIVTKFEGETDDADWVAYRALVPGAAGNPRSAREDLAAFVIGDNDTGRLSVVRLQSADGRLLTSPRIAQNLIAADPDVTQLLTLLNASDSRVAFGPMTPIVNDDTLAWVRPLIVLGSSDTATPRLQSVLAVSNGRVGIGPTARQALAATLDGG